MNSKYMLKKLISITVLTTAFLSPATSFAQGWVVFNLDVLDENLYDGNNLNAPNDIDFYEDAGYALGNNGTMYKSFDNGKSWIGASDDGVGDTWVGFNEKYAIFDLYVLANDTVMIVSSGNNVYKSDDSARSFDDSYLGFLNSSKYEWVLKSKQITDSQYLFIDGEHIYKTNDAFKTGYVLYDALSKLGVDEYLCNMGSSDSGKGIIAVVCNASAILVSEDYGKSFERHDLEFNPINTKIEFASEDVVYMVSGDGHMYKSVNNGFDWTAVPEPNNVTHFSQKISFLDKSNGVTVGYTYGYGEFVYNSQIGERMYFTSNGGASWTLMNSYVEDSNEFMINDIYYDSSDRIFAVGSCDDGTDTKLNGACILRYNTSRGVLLKSDESSKVYYSGQDGELHWIPSESIFYSWYSGFDDVETVSQDYIDSLKMSDNARARKAGEARDLGSVMNW